MNYFPEPYDHSTSVLLYLLIQQIWYKFHKFKNVPSGLSSLKSKVDELDVDKLKPVSIDLKNQLM